MFNHRRQSQDKMVRDTILKISSKSNLWMNTYSYKLFTEVVKENIKVDELFLNKAAKGDYCFNENHLLIPYENRIEQIILFNWNKTYPSDLFLDIDLNLWSKVHVEDFVGSSHQIITKEIYKRRGENNA